MAVTYRVKTQSKRLTGNSNKKQYAVRVQRSEINLTRLCEDKPTDPCSVRAMYMLV